MDQVDSETRGHPEFPDNCRKVMTITAESAELQALLRELEDALEAAPLHVRKQAFDLFDHASELVCVQNGVTEGAGITVLLEPSQLLRDLIAAMRTGDLDGLAIQHSH